MKNKYFTYYPLLWVFLISITLLLGIYVTVSAESPGTDAMLVWSKKGERGYDVHITQRANFKWSEPKQLSFSDGEEILPTVAFTPSGYIWVVWSEIADGLDGRLRYRA